MNEQDKSEAYIDYLLNCYWNEKIQVDKDIACEIDKKSFWKKNASFWTWL